jgi:CCR4-NOT transcription complex subunit 6
MKPSSAILLTTPQEVDILQYEEFFQPTLHGQGYESCYSAKSRAKTMTDAKRKEVDGCATFFKADKCVRIIVEIIKH